MGDCSNIEFNIVSDNNNLEPRQLDPQHFNDPLDVINASGKHIGYSWNYGDSVELVIHIQDTVLHVDEEHLDELEVYLSDKEIEMNFINMRGKVCYTYYLKAGIDSKIRLNTCACNMIDKNTYTCTLVLINPYDLSRINLLREPYKIYVK